MNIFETVTKVVLDMKGNYLDKNEITFDSHIINDIGLDSIRLVELITLLEQELDITIPDEDMVGENFTTIGRVCALISSRI
ncbi:acyl carrier protein [Paenibacillus pinihumi]|uniref:acyl carrier protein n=1 Tax=Paenibacillus pinihumi TaxID=669462 RepID=UPI000490FE63|nr:acyl carrier protein [Paenibacillus pinihumi]